MALHERSLDKGAAVTVVWGVDGKLVLRRGHAVGHTTDGRIKMVTDGGLSLCADYDSEGTRWMRGHVRGAEYDGKALLASAQLRSMVE